MNPSGVLSFTMKTIDGQEKPLADYADHVLLIVNTASRCGYTPQYRTLEALYQKFKDRGFRILAFPANNFGAQESGTDAEIEAFCSTTYHVTFDLFSKISVKGADRHALYTYLTTQSGSPGEIKWNFNKFLVDRSGTVVARYESNVDPMSDSIVHQVEALLAQ
ncbi:MAG: glutathione peroxidase [Candidatus Latescibacteria bacterium]|nr:glutathione peroxidase [Candidatus Latescibacterota bacterium]